jgi:hypothetical protein
MMQRIVILLLLIPIGIMPMYGQTLKAYITAAENAYAEKDLFTAFTHFETAVGVDSSRYDLQYKLADVAREYHSYSVSEELYQNVLDSEDSNEYPTAAYWLARMQQIQGDYDNALTNYQIFVSEQPDADSALIDDANLQIEAVQWAKENYLILDDSTTVERLGEQINTLYCEFGATRKDSSIYFTRLAFERQRYDQKNRPILPALLFSQEMVAQDSSGGVELMDSTFNDPVKHTGNIAFNHDQTRVYFTLCEYLNKSDIRCDLYYRDIVDGAFGEAHMLPEPVNAGGYTTTQPNLGYHEELGKEILYFVSDRPGGKGKRDIWYSVVNDPNTFTTPEALAALNTSQDDMTPFYHAESKTFFYSSEGMVGFGALDIYRAQEINGVWTKPENIGADVNSSYDDVYYALSSDEKSALFSSNRLGSTYFESSREACCFDIYEVSAQPVEVNLLIET